MVTNDATTPAFYGRSNRQKIAVTTVKNKRQSLMGYTEQTCGARNAASGFFERSANEVAFVAKYFSIERKAWWHRRASVVACAASCVRRSASADGENASRTFSQASS